LLRPAREVLRELAMLPNKDQVRVATASLGNSAGLEWGGGFGGLGRCCGRPADRRQSSRQASHPLMLSPVCPTPMRQSQRDVTLRVLEVLKQVDLVACEDTRHTRILLDTLWDSARLVSFHGSTEQRARSPSAAVGVRVRRTWALVSDAGMPGISDPGFSLVRACIAESVPVTVLPGPSSVVTALVLSGAACGPIRIRRVPCPREEQTERPVGRRSTARARRWWLFRVAATAARDAERHRRAMASRRRRSAGSAGS